MYPHSVHVIIALLGHQHPRAMMAKCTGDFDICATALLAESWGDAVHARHCAERACSVCDAHAYHTTACIITQDHPLAIGEGPTISAACFRHCQCVPGRLRSM